MTRGDRRMDFARQHRGWLKLGQVNAEGGAASAPKVPTCCYLVPADGGGQRECGELATHHAARNFTLFLCNGHAAHVLSLDKFRLVKLPAADSQPETSLK